MGSEFITPADWNFPWGNVEGIQGNYAYFARLTEIESEMNYLNQHEGHSYDHDICETSLLFQQIMLGK